MVECFEFRPPLPSIYRSHQLRSHIAFSSVSSHLDLSTREKSGQQFNSVKVHDYLYQPPTHLIKLIEKHHTEGRQKKNRYTISDIVALTGQPFEKVQKDFLKLVYLANARMMVDQYGDIIYEFPLNFQRTIYQKSMLYRIQSSAVVKKLLMVLIGIVKASFGVILMVSLAFVVVSIVSLMILASSGGGSNDDDEKKKKKKNQHRSSYNNNYGHYHPRPLFLDVIFRPIRVFNINLYDPAVPTFRENSKSPTSRYLLNSNNKDDDETPYSFPEACFSFLFGDGSLNAGFEEKLTVKLADLARSSDGVLISEQVIPFLSNPPPLPPSIEQILTSKKGKSSVWGDQSQSIVGLTDESYVLKPLLSLRGNVVLPKLSQAKRFRDLEKQAVSASAAVSGFSSGTSPSDVSDSMEHLDHVVLYEFPVSDISSYHILLYSSTNLSPFNRSYCPLQRLTEML